MRKCEILQKYGIKISLVGDKVKLSPKDLVTPQVIEFVKTYKAEIIREVERRDRCKDCEFLDPQFFCLRCGEQRSATDPTCNEFSFTDVPLRVDPVDLISLAMREIEDKYKDGAWFWVKTHQPDVWRKVVNLERKMNELATKGDILSLEAVLTEWKAIHFKMLEDYHDYCANWDRNKGLISWSLSTPRKEDGERRGEVHNPGEEGDEAEDRWI